MWTEVAISRPSATSTSTARPDSVPKSTPIVYLGLMMTPFLRVESRDWRVESRTFTILAPLFTLHSSPLSTLESPFSLLMAINCPTQVLTESFFDCIGYLRWVYGHMVLKAVFADIVQ